MPPGSRHRKSGRVRAGAHTLSRTRRRSGCHSPRHATRGICTEGRPRQGWACTHPGACGAEQTTAAAIWVTAAIGSAAGAGLPLLAILATGIYFLVAVAFPVVTRRLPRSTTAISALRVRYPDGRSILRNVLREATARGFAIDDVATEALGYRRPPGQAGTVPEPRMVEVTLHVHGKNSVNELAAALSEQQDVDAVLATDVNATDG